MRLDTGPAFLLAPLVQVARAEGKVTDRERDTVLRLAAARGVEAGSPAHTQLLKWLQERPSDVSLRHGHGGHQRRARPPAAGATERLKRIVQACHEVAEASRSRQGAWPGSGVSGQEEGCSRLLPPRSGGLGPRSGQISRDPPTSSRCSTDHLNMNIYDTREGVRLMNQQRKGHWNRWGPFLSERAWGTVREDYSANGDAGATSRTITPVRGPIVGTRMAWRASRPAPVSVLRPGALERPGCHPSRSGCLA